MGVDLHDHSDLRVAQDLHNLPGMHVEINQQCGAGAPPVVHRDLADPGLGTAGIPRAIEVTRFDRRAPLGGKDQFVALPRRPC